MEDLGGKNQFVDLGYFDESSVNLTVSPQTPDEYLKQVIVGRRSCPNVVRADVQNSFEPVTRESRAEEDDSREAEVSWQLAKSSDFGLKRKWVQQQRKLIKTVNYKWPARDDVDKWEQILLEKSPSEFDGLCTRFPNHLGTPPAVSIVQSLAPTQVDNLIPLLVEWAEAGGLSRPIREWIFSLLLVVELPLLHDVVSAIRSLSKIARVTRSTLSDDRQEEIVELSWFIAIIGRFFNQKDICDRSDIHFIQ